MRPQPRAALDLLPAVRIAVEEASIFNGETPSRSHDRRNGRPHRRLPAPAGMIRRHPHGEKHRPSRSPHPQG